MTPEQLAACVRIPLDRLLGERPVRYDAEGYELIKGAVLEGFNAGYDPYDNTPNVYAEAFYSNHVRNMQAIVERDMNRLASQLLECGYDPYNNQRQRVTLFVHVPSHVTRKP